MTEIEYLNLPCNDGTTVFVRFEPSTRDFSIEHSGGKVPTLTAKELKAVAKWARQIARENS